MIKKAISLLLCFCTFILILSSCGESPINVDTIESISETESETEPHADISQIKSNTSTEDESEIGYARNDYVWYEGGYSSPQEVATAILDFFYKSDVDGLTKCLTSAKLREITDIYNARSRYDLEMQSIDYINSCLEEDSEAKELLRKLNQYNIEITSIEVESSGLNNTRKAIENDNKMGFTYQEISQINNYATIEIYYTEFYTENESDIDGFYVSCIDLSGNWYLLKAYTLKRDSSTDSNSKIIRDLLSY